MNNKHVFVLFCFFFLQISFAQELPVAERFIVNQKVLESKIEKFQNDTALSRIIKNDPKLNEYISTWVMHSALNRQSAIQFNENAILKETVLNEQRKTWLLSIVVLIVLISFVVVLIYFIVKFKKIIFC